MQSRHSTRRFVVIACLLVAAIGTAYFGIEWIAKLRTVTDDGKSDSGSNSTTSGAPLAPAQIRKAWRLFAAGRAKFEVQKWDEARTTFAALLELAPREAAAIHALAATELRAGNAARARELLAAIDVAADQRLGALVANALGNLESEASGGDSAAGVVAHRRRAAQLDPDEAAYWYALAEAHQHGAAPDAQAALAALKEALARWPESTRIGVEYGLLAVASADAEVRKHGIEALERAIAAIVDAGGVDERIASEMARGRAELQESSGGAAPGALRIATNLARASRRFQDDAKLLARRLEVRPLSQLLSPLLRLPPPPAAPRIALAPIEFAMPAGVIATAIVDDALTPEERAANSYSADPGADSSGILFLTPNELWWRTPTANAPPVRIECGISAPAADVVTGDLDGDGRMEAVVLDASGIKVLTRDAAGNWQARAHEAPLAQIGACRAALLVDHDHDGFLDLLALARDSPAETANNLLLLRNSEAAGLSAPIALPLDAAGKWTHLTAADLDDDGDLDLALAGEVGLVVARNDRQERFIAARTIALAAAVTSLLVADLEADGKPEVAVTTGGAVRVFDDVASDGRGDLAACSVATIELAKSMAATSLRACDLDLDGDLDLIVGGRALAADGSGLALLIDGGESFASEVVDGVESGIEVLDCIDLDGDHDTDLLCGQEPMPGSAQASAGLALGVSGAETQGWLMLRLRAPRVIVAGAKVPQDAKGVKIDLHTDHGLFRYQIDRPTVTLGFGAAAAHLVRITWPNGMSEYLFDPSARDAIEVLLEIRLEGSCPFLYARDGDSWRFVTDALGISPLGMLVAVGVHNPLHPEEYLRLPEWVSARDGALEFLYTEELREVTYLDQLELVAIDSPPGVIAANGERFVIPPVVGLDLRLIAAPLPLDAATDHSGRDARATLAQEDHRYLTNHVARTRYQGLVEEHSLILDLATARRVHGERLALVLVGWLQYGNTSTNLAIARDPTLDFHWPELQVPDGEGGWRATTVRLGLPAGKPKTIVVDLNGVVLADDPRIRLVTNLEVYWDWIAVAALAPIDTPFVETRLAPARARYRYGGYSRWYRPAENGPDLFDASDRRPYPWRTDAKGVDVPYAWDLLEGHYLDYGEVVDLLVSRDDASVTLGSGEEIQVSFDVDTLPALASGWTRTFFLHSEGWDKDGDFNTATSQTLEPLPFHDLGAYPPDRPWPSTEAHRRYAEERLTRHVPRDLLRRIVESSTVGKDRER